MKENEDSDEDSDDEDEEPALNPTTPAKANEEIDEQSASLDSIVFLVKTAPPTRNLCKKFTERGEAEFSASISECMESHF